MGSLFPQTQFLRSFEGLTKVTRSVIDFVALFRTRREFIEVESRNFLTDKVVATHIAGSILANKENNIDVYYPNIYASSLDFSDQAYYNDALSKINRLNQLLARGQQAASGSLAGRNSELTDLNDSTQEFIDGIDKKQLLKGLRAYDIFKQNDNAYILYVDIIYALGNNQSTQSLFSGTTVRHSGNIMLSYILFDKNGSIYNSDLLYYHSGFEEFDSPRDSK